MTFSNCWENESLIVLFLVHHKYKVYVYLSPHIEPACLLIYVQSGARHVPCRNLEITPGTPGTCLKVFSNLLKHSSYSRSKQLCINLS